MVGAGADIIEVGLPYSDPVLDGPVIAEAVHIALAGGTDVADVLRTVQAVAASGVAGPGHDLLEPGRPVRRDAFARDLAAAGGSGLITPDLPPEEAGAWLGPPTPAAWTGCSWSRPAPPTSGWRRSPASPRLRLRRLADGHHRHPGRAQRRRGRPGRADPRHTGLPVARGPGREQRRPGGPGGRFADGVIVGSAFVRRLLEAADVGQPAAGAARPPTSPPSWPPPSARGPHHRPGSLAV